MLELDVLHLGGRSEQCRACCEAMNQRLTTRALHDYVVPVQDGPMTVSRRMLESATVCAWALGAQVGTLKAMEREEIIPIGVARMIRNPGLRSAEQKEIGRRRIARYRKTGEHYGTARPDIITAAQLGLKFQNLFGPKGTVTRGAGHYTAGNTVSNRSELIAEAREIHRQHGPNGGAAYEAIVGGDGTIVFANPMSRKSAAVKANNTGMVNICCPGTTGDRMTRAQKESVRWLMDNWHTDAVPQAHRLPVRARTLDWRGHKDHPNQSTACPGDMLKDYKEVW